MSEHFNERTYAKGRFCELNELIDAKRIIVNSLKQSLISVVSSEFIECDKIEALNKELKEQSKILSDLQIEKLNLKTKWEL